MFIWYSRVDDVIVRSKEGICTLVVTRVHTYNKTNRQTKFKSNGSKHRRKLLILLTLFPRRKHGILDPSDNCTLLSSSSFQAMTESKVSSLVKSLTTKDPTASL